MKNQTVHLFITAKVQTLQSWEQTELIDSQMAEVAAVKIKNIELGLSLLHLCEAWHCILYFDPFDSSF